MLLVVQMLLLVLLVLLAVLVILTMLMLVAATVVSVVPLVLFELLWCMLHCSLCVYVQHVINLTKLLNY